MKNICIDTELEADHFNIFFVTKNLILKKKIRKKVEELYEIYKKIIYRIYNFLEDSCCYGNLICKSIQYSIYVFINDIVNSRLVVNT